MVMVALATIAPPSGRTSVTVRIAPPAVPRTVRVPSTVHPVSLRVGRYGPYLEWRDKRASVPEGLAPDEITPERAAELLDAAGQADQPLGQAPDAQNVYLRIGRFGPYVQLGEDPEDTEKKKKEYMGIEVC